LATLLAEVAATLPPLASAGRCTAIQAQIYLGVSLPTIYEMIKAGELHSYVDDGHRWITPQSIKNRALPPEQRKRLGKSVKFARIRQSPNPRAVVGP
jgi:excisionase family DNA binding protein